MELRRAVAQGQGLSLPYYDICQGCAGHSIGKVLVTVIDGCSPMLCLTALVMLPQPQPLQSQMQLTLLLQSLMQL